MRIVPPSGRKAGRPKGSGTPAVIRFWRHVNKDGPLHPTLGTRCWLWTGATDDKGYGKFRHSDTATMPAHRFALELAAGPIDPDLLACHTCDNPPCVNADHLFAGTGLDNIRDMIKKGRAPLGYGVAHCLKGHPYSPENTYLRSSGRRCRTCARAYDQRYQQNRRLSEHGGSVVCEAP